MKKLKHSYRILKEDENDVIVGFTGTQHQHDKLRRPSVEQPFFIALELDYALTYTSGRTANEAEETAHPGFIQVIKVPKTYLKCLDLTNDADNAVKLLKFPEIMQFMFFAEGGMQWQVGQLFRRFINELGEFTFARILRTGQNFNEPHTMSRMNDFLSCVTVCNPKELKKRFPTQKFTSKQLYDFVKWVSEHEYLKGSLETYFRSARTATYKESYKVVEELIFRPVHDLGYNSFANRESTSECIGFMDEDLIQNCSIKQYTAQEAVEKFGNS